MAGGATAGSAVLAQLLAQAGERGADMATLRAIAEEAGELGVDLAEAGQRQSHDDQAIDHHQAHGLRPGQPLGGYEGHSHQRVDAQARGNTEWVLGDHAEQNGHHTRGEGSGRRYARATQHVTIDIRAGAQDQRVEHYDVCHREEGNHASADFRGEGGAALGDVEITVESAELSGTGGR